MIVEARPLLVWMRRRGQRATPGALRAPGPRAPSIVPRAGGRVGGLGGCGVVCAVLLLVLRLRWKNRERRLANFFRWRRPMGHAPPPPPPPNATHTGLHGHQRHPWHEPVNHARPFPHAPKGSFPASTPRHTTHTPTHHNSLHTAHKTEWRPPVAPNPRSAPSPPRPSSRNGTTTSRPPTRASCTCGSRSRPRRRETRPRPTEGGR